MSIVITVNAENGADARKELIDLLGFGLTPITVSPVTIKGTDLIIEHKSEKVDADGQTPFVEQTTEQPAEEKKKRRTKAEIEAEKAALAANTGSEEPPASADTAEEKSTEPSHPDLPALQRVCAILVRAGYKADAVKVITDVGKAPSSADVLPENRQAVIDALTELAKQQNVAL